MMLFGVFFSRMNQTMTYAHEYSVDDLNSVSYWIIGRTYKVTCLLLNGHVGELIVKIGIVRDHILKLLPINHVHITLHLDLFVASILEVFLIFIIL